MSFEEHTVGGCRLILGDCREVLPTLGKVDALVTDPPYGVGLGQNNNPHRNGGYGAHLGKAGYLNYDDSYPNFVTEIVPRLNVSLDRAACAAVFSGPHIHEQRKPVAIGGVFLAQSCGRTTWGSKNFLPVLFYGKPPGAGQHRPTVIRDSSRPDPSPHPCPKPLTWMSWLVGLASVEGETVLDPFAGSFTTGLACLRLGRPFIGIEIEKRYFDFGCTRLEAASEEELWQLPGLKSIQCQEEFPSMSVLHGGGLRRHA